MVKVIILSYVFLFICLTAVSAQMIYDNPKLPRLESLPMSICSGCGGGGNSTGINETAGNLLWIRLDGTTTTTAQIPFARGIQIDSDPLGTAIGSIIFNNSLYAFLEEDKANINYDSGTDELLMHGMNSKDNLAHGGGIGIETGDGFENASSGTLNIRTGDGGTENGNSGDVVIITGNPSGTGTRGRISLSGRNVFVDTDLNSSGVICDSVGCIGTGGSISMNYTNIVMTNKSNNILGNQNITNLTITTDGQNTTIKIPSGQSLNFNDDSDVFMTLDQSDYVTVSNLRVNNNTITSSIFINNTNALFDAIKATGNLNNYFQFNIQNKNNGSSASSDIVATSNIGDETNYYIDLGINSANYSQELFNITGKNDGYLYVQNGSLAISTASVGKNISFTVGGTTTSQLAGIFSVKGLNVNNNVTAKGFISTVAIGFF